jgi:hypothetical protein
MNFNIPCRSIPMPYFVGQSDYSKLPLTIENIGTTNATVSGNYGQFSLDGGNTWTNATTQTTLTPGSKVIISGNITNNYIRYRTSNSKTIVYGNINSLVNGASTMNTTYKFHGMFSGCTNIVDASNMVLPFSSLQENCYQQLFMNCSSLTAIPSLTSCLDYSSIKGVFD